MSYEGAFVIDTIANSRPKYSHSRPSFNFATDS